MSTTKLALGLLTLGALSLPLIPAPAMAQRAPTGVEGVVSALHPSEQLGGGSLTGAGSEIKLGLTPRITLGLSGVWYLNAATEPMHEEPRVYDLFIPSLNVRASLVGQESDLALLLSTAAYRYTLAASGGLPGETLAIPALGMGAGVRVHLTGPLYLNFEARDWLLRTRDGELGSLRGQVRRFSHTPEVRISLSALFRKREPVLASFDDLPLSYARDFRPVDASAVVRPPLSRTLGRDHLHGDRGELVPLLETADELATMNPIEPMTKAVASPVPVYEEHMLGTVYFELGSTEVATKYRSLLQDVARFLEENPGARLSVRGFTDPSGPVPVNLSISERRGTAVAELLVRLYNVDPERVDVLGYGVDYRAEKAEHARRAELVSLIPVD